MGLLKVLLITILVLWVLRIIVRLLLPYLMAKIVGKVQKEARRQYERQTGSHARESSPRPDGGIRIDYVPPKTQKGSMSSSNGKVGEFVDFEEIN